MNDYERVARIIRLLDARHAEQPDLSTLARHAGLSPSHFHRLFRSWAGITPKDFLQCLTLAHARELLKKGESVLDVALISGLSGPGRLHDLCVSMEAASPGELKSGGEGWTLSAGFADSPFGRCLIGTSPRGICHLSFVEPAKDRAQLSALQKDWPRAQLHRDDAQASQLAGRIFGEPTGRPRPAIRTFVRGTAFQVRVWRALLNIAPGTLTSYGRLARAVGAPRAARAVGTAVGRNPIGYLIPCHRVIRETGALGQYGGGADRKCAMVVWETAPRSAADSVAIATT